MANVYRHLEAFHVPCMNLLRKKGYEVHAYARPDRGRQGLVENNIICHDVDFSRNPCHPNNLRALLALTASFKKEKYLLVHIHTPVPGVVGRIAAGLTQIPCVVYTVHGFHFFRGASLVNWCLYYPLERMMARWTDCLITINEEDYQLASVFKVKNKIYLVPGVGVETDRYQPGNEKYGWQKKREALNLKPDDFVILSVAELNRNKNHHQIIEAMHHLNKKFKSVYCLIAGEGAEKETLLNRVRQLGLSNNIRFLGFRNDIPELMACSDVVTLLSKKEGLPKALMEALAAGKPIIATDVRGNRDLVADGVNGFLVPLNDNAATVKSFEKMILDQQLRAQISLTNIKKSFNYDIKAVIEEMDLLYNNLLQHSTQISR